LLFMSRRQKKSLKLATAREARTTAHNTYQRNRWAPLVRSGGSEASLRILVHAKYFSEWPTNWAVVGGVGGEARHERMAGGNGVSFGRWKMVTRLTFTFVQLARNDHCVSGTGRVHQTLH
jgi:hypothetical protein